MTGRWNEILASGKSTLVPGIFNGITARLAEKMGFRACWVSGFSVSASMGIPDSSCMSIESYISRVKEISSASNVMLLADCDEGFGSLDNSLYLIDQLMNCGVEAVCLEDNKFPKINSFIENGDERKLEDEKVFSEKLSAIRSAFPSLGIMARTEALIAGHSLSEAIARGISYAAAGAEIILIHSRYESENDFRELISRWQSPVPLAVIPTRADKMTFSDFAGLGFRIVVYANQLLRSSVYAMENVLKSCQSDEHLGRISEQAVSMEYVFELTEMAKLIDESKADNHG